MTFASTFGRVLSPTFQPKSQAAVVAGGTWWDLDGTITSCVVAYQPKGAASYAASKVNLANAGTLNAVDGAAYPTWDATNGWMFASASTQYLDTGATILLTWTFIVRFYNAPSGVQVVCGQVSSPYTLNRLIPNRNDLVYYGSSTKAPGIASGVLALAGDDGYRNGTLDYENANVGIGGATAVSFYLGAQHEGANAAAPYGGYIQAFAAYNSVLTAQNIADLTTAMNAL